MLWFAVWAVLAVLALVVLGRLGWSVFRKGVALAGELGRASERVSEIAAQVDQLAQLREPPELAVFEDPRRLRRERDLRERERQRRRRRAARRARLTT